MLWRCNQPNPEWGEFYETSYFISSTNKQHEKTKELELSQIKGDLRDASFECNT